jgi:hypothetical protein
MTIDAHQEEALGELAAGQAGVVARRQLRALGVPRTLVRSHLRGHRWQRVLPGTFVVFTGPLPFPTRVWAAILYAGPNATASHETAAWLWGLETHPPVVVDVTVPHARRHRATRPGVRVRQSRHLLERRHPVLVPPRTRIEDTVLDLTDAARSPEPVIGVVLRACQNRLTTAGRLATRARSRRRLRWRKLIAELLADARDGATTPLERRYARDVERAHGLPRGRRNLAEGPPRRRRYRDVRYLRWRLVVELDGRAAHPAHERERDDLRDNELVEADGTLTLRYGWVSVSARPCRTAAQIVRVLRSAGWTGKTIRCGPCCSLD